MPEILPAHVPMPRCVIGWDGTRYRAFAVDSDGQLQIDVLSTVMDAAAATAANQATMITALQLIDDLRNALGSVNTDDLQVDVKTSGLPTGGSTAANQTTMITALQLIDDLRAALESVATDRLKVRGEDQLESIGGVLVQEKAATISGANGSVNFAAVGAGLMWHLTGIYMVDVTTATTAHQFGIWRGATQAMIHYDATARAAGIPSSTHEDFWLVAGDALYLFFVGGQVGDTCVARINGTYMAIET